MAIGGATAARAGHAVTFYERDPDLLSELLDFVCGGLAAGERVIVVATDDHASRLREALGALGVDVAHLTLTRQLRWLDADKTLSAFQVDGRQSAVGFESAIGAMVDDALRDGAPVRVFGEMVALLWERGDVLGAIELERRWNKLAATRTFSLLCGYPLRGVASASWSLVEDVCREHTAVLPQPRAGDRLVDLVPSEGVDDHRTRLFLGVPSEVCSVRRFVADVLTEWRYDDLLSDGVLVASELATNVVLHAGSPFRVSVARTGLAVTIAVEDGGTGRPSIGRSAQDAVDGRGVLIVDAISRAWGTQDKVAGKVVWAELRSAAVIPTL